MGINKNNIRFVIHGDLPKSMEGYYQETGRAGRDGLDSICVLFFSTGDIVKQQYFINRMEDPHEQIKCRNNLNSLVRFATVNVCRRKQVLEYFGETHEGNCGHCDVCNDVTDTVDATVDARKVLSAIVRTNEGFGINYIIDIVWGADTEKIRCRNHNSLKTFGVGRDKSKKWWRRIINELIGQQMIYQDFERYNVLTMTESGRRVLFGEESFFIRESTAVGESTRAVRADLFTHSGVVDSTLFKQLKQKRTELAREKRVPPYIIFSDKTLTEMARLQPVNDDEFLCVSGVGKKKLEVFGPHFLPIISEYLKK